MLMRAREVRPAVGYVMASSGVMGSGAILGSDGPAPTSAWIARRAESLRLRTSI